MIKYVTLILLIATLFVGCGTIGFFGKSSNQLQKQELKITKLDNRINDLQINKLNDISQLSFGVGKALDNITNAPIEVKVASELNTRVEAITGLPRLEQQKEMIKLVSDLISNNIAGKIELAKKDNDIQSIQNEETYLIKAKDKQIDNLDTLSKSIALQADTTKQELSSYKSYWGLGGILLGAKSLITHIFWSVLIFGVIFTILRFAAATNPIANLCFGIFQQFAGIAIHCIESLVPSSISVVEQAKADVSQVSATIGTIATTIVPPAK